MSIQSIYGNYSGNITTKTIQNKVKIIRFFNKINTRNLFDRYLQKYFNTKYYN